MALLMVINDFLILKSNEQRIPNLKLNSAQIHPSQHKPVVIIRLIALEREKLLYKMFLQVECSSWQVNPP